MKPINLLYLATSRPPYEHPDSVPSVVLKGTDVLRNDPAFSFSIRHSRPKIPALLWRIFERYFIKRTTIGFRLDQALRHLIAMRRQDVVFAQTDSLGLPVLLLKRLGLIQARVGFISAGLINNLENKTHIQLFRFYAWLLQAADFIVCWSPIEAQSYQELTNAPGRFVLLEGDPSFYQPGSPEEEQAFILCVGRDLGRDWSTVLEALGKLGTPAKIVTSAHRVKGQTIPPNVELHTEQVSFETLNNWYRQAQLVIVNPQEIGRFTGQRALLEALGMRKATVAARTRALVSTYDLQDQHEVLFYEPGQVNSLVSVVQHAQQNLSLRGSLAEQGRAFIESLPKDAFGNGIRDLILEDS